MESGTANDGRNAGFMQAGQEPESAAPVAETQPMPPAIPYAAAPLADGQSGGLPGDYPMPPAEPKWPARLGWGAAILALAVAGGYAGGELSRQSRPAFEVPFSPGDGGASKRAERSVATIAAGVLPSVVSIQVKGSEGSGTGSGFVVDEKGYVVTNHHVIDGATRDSDIRVFFPDGSSAAAERVGSSPSYDLAVLKVDRTGLAALSFGDSSKVVVGDFVVAVGAPLGLDGTVTTGIVSALNRPVGPGPEDKDQASINAIQMDAAINPGNSGGPLVNASGQVIGVNSAIAQIPSLGGGSGSIGLGFAIPSNQAMRTIDQLINKGKATYPLVGVLLDSSYDGEGVRILDREVQGQQPVTPGSPADKAGIKPGDVITHVDGRPINRNVELIVAIRARKVGDAMEVTVRSGGEDRPVKLVLSDSKVDE